MPSEAALQELLDKQDILEIVGARYARALDWIDGEMLKTCFHDDGWVDYGFFTGNAHEWCEMVMPHEREVKRRWHLVTNVRIEISDDIAEAESYCLTVGTRQQDNDSDIDTTYGGRFLDRLERRDGIWKIASRRFVLDWKQQMPSGVELDSGLANLPLSDGYDLDHKLYRPMGPRNTT